MRSKTSTRCDVGTNIIGAHSVEELCSKLKTPRRIILLVKAGKAVDDFIAQLEPYLEKGDIIIDGGNSHYPDSIRRTHELEAKGLLFVGSGVSGGEEGARNGPSLMPGGSDAAWPHIKEIFRKYWVLGLDGSRLTRFFREDCRSGSGRALLRLGRSDR